MSGSWQGAPDPVRYEALGRVMLAIREGRLRGYLPSLDWWRCMDDSFAIEWREGPFASEVAGDLIRMGGLPDEAYGALYGKVSPATKAEDNYAELAVCGVPFSLRALDPVGFEATHERVWSELRANLQPAVS